MFAPRLTRLFSQRTQTCWQQTIKRNLCSSSSKELMEANVTYLKDEWRGNDIFLIGTMHVSEESAKEVQRLIRDVKPDVVMVELDAARAIKLRQQYGKVTNDDFAKAVVPLNQLPMPMGFNFIEEMMKKFYEYFRILGIIPGKEFLVAMEEADKIGAEIILGDRNVQVTLARLINSFSLQSLMGVLRQLEIYNVVDMFSRNSSRPKLDPQDPTSILNFLESIRNRRDVRELTKKTRKVCPDMGRVMIDERDVYMVNSLRRINVQNKKIVAVVGLGHLDGMEEFWMSHKARAKKLGLSEDDLNKP